MSESLSVVSGDSQNPPGPSMESATVNAETNSEEATKKRRYRKRWSPEEISIAIAISKLAPIGDNIAYGDLPTMDMKIASLVMAKKYRLIERGLLEPDIDIESGRVESVRIVPEVWEEYAEDLILPEPKAKQANGEVLRSITPRSILSDPKFKIKKLKAENPRREGSHAWHNWPLYVDGGSVVDYLNFMDYDRHIKVPSRFGGQTYFNGPSILLLMQDLKAGNISVYDSTLNESDPGYRLTANDIESRSTSSDEDEDSESSGIPETPQQSGESVGQQPVAH